jgi:glycosyltransferase involved in cell wall biosynthesis
MNKLNSKIAMFADGPLLPSAEGASWRFLKLLDALDEVCSDVTLIHCYRGWSSWKELSNLKYKVILLHPDDYYKNPILLKNILLKENFDLVLSKDIEYISYLITDDLLPKSTKIAYDCHDVRTPSDGTIDNNDILVSSYCDYILTISKDEYQQLNQIKIIQDKVFYLPPTIEFSKKISMDKHKNSLVFLGHYYYEPNAESAKWIYSEVMPLIWNSLPDVKLTFIGLAPESLKNELNHPNIIWKGYVKDLSTELKQYQVGIAAVKRGTGFRIKTLHYMAAGVPVVTNKVGTDGIGEQNCFFISESTEEIAKSCINLILSEDLRLECMSKAFKILNDEFTHQALCQKVSGLISLLIKQKEYSSSRARLETSNWVEQSLVKTEIERLQSIAQTPLTWLEEIVFKGRFRSLTSEMMTPGKVFDLKNRIHLNQLENKSNFITHQTQ